jgi:thymidylate kinase
MIELKNILHQKNIDYISYDLTKASPIEKSLKLELISKNNPELREVDDDFCEQLYIERANYHYEELQKDKTNFASDPLIIGDRSIITSIVTRWKRVDQIGEDQYIDQILRGRLFEMPDVIFYLDLAIDKIKERQNHRLGTTGRTYGLREEKIDRLIDIEKTYHYLMKDCQNASLKSIRWIVIDASQTPTEIAQTIFKHLV